MLLGFALRCLVLVAVLVAVTAGFVTPPAFVCYMYIQNKDKSLLEVALLTSPIVLGEVAFICGLLWFVKSRCVPAATRPAAANSPAMEVAFETDTARTTALHRGSVAQAVDDVMRPAAANSPAMEVAFETDTARTTALHRGSVAQAVDDVMRLGVVGVAAAPEEWSCAICSEDLPGSDGSPLAGVAKGREYCHAFHRECLERWVTTQTAQRSKPTCPTCRHPLGDCPV